MSLGWLLAGAAVAGIIGGVVLAERRESRLETEMQALEEQLEDTLGPPGESRYEGLMAPPEDSLAGIAPYPGASPRHMHQNPRGAAKLSVSWFFTEDAPEKVLSFYEGAFAKAGTPFITRRFVTGRGGYASYLERTAPVWDSGVAEGIVHMVSALREGGHTIVLVSASEPSKMLQRASTLPAGVVLPPEAGPPLVIALGERFGARTSIHASVGLGAAETAAWLEKTLTGNGWALKRGADRAGRTTLEGNLHGVAQSLLVESEDAGVARVTIMVEPELRGPEVIQ